MKWAYQASDCFGSKASEAENCGNYLEKTVLGIIYAIILAHFFTAIFFAWVNLCKK
jgi:hypothetical protein